MMDIKVYQIDPAKDIGGVMPVTLDVVERLQGTPEVDAGIYRKVFEGGIDDEDPERISEILYRDRPEGYDRGPVSVSDVVAVRDRENGSVRYYYRGDTGFRPIRFNEDRAAGSAGPKMRVVICDPGEPARAAEIGTDLEDMQKVVGGMIEAYYPFEEEVCIVCNDEGKINGMRPCRAIFDEGKRIRDIIFGPFFICGCGDSEFVSLSDEQIDRYVRMYEKPERFLRIGGEITAVPYDPRRDMQHMR